MDHFGSTQYSSRGAEPHVPFSDELLVLAAQDGHEWAFTELCSRCSRRILIMLFKITKNHEDAEDVLQESILKAYVHFKNFNQASTFSTWLTRISLNSAFMMLRRRRVRPERSADEPADAGKNQSHWEIADRRANAEELFIDHENDVRLRTAISRLPTPYRQVIEIRQQTDGSLKEIAQRTGITVAATKSRMMRAKKALRASLS
ncbi:RNA polymerase sigma factor [Terracidiphilus gabretensis]|jgi:RNA polymerase sigma-70 factor, ECF subfamily|uniref:RNA polymerase sigma factor n=1 Tax=Terracidiphilus gabretensis TaxID=1577687 RepID=UPI00071B45BE|nr:sigma-70 family RNA polymerase sigma factor [Terracidiphilus gabretensis]